MPNNFNETEPQPATPLAQTTPQAQDIPQTQDTPVENTNSGQLVVSVFTANQVLPVVGAAITVTAENGTNENISETSDTDRSGRSVIFTLPAPSASMSQEPTNAIPFAEYTVRVSHPQYFDAIIENVQIFDGILTQLPVNLIPLPEISGRDIDNTIIIPRQNL